MYLPYLLLTLLIFGREPNLEPIYGLEVDQSWQESPCTKDLSDTREPIYMLYKSNLKLTLHNFPKKEGEGIPPRAQAARWREQCGDGEIWPVSFGGFEGLIFEGPETLALALQLAPSAERNLRYEELFLGRAETKQRISDVTIKVVGPQSQLNLEKEKIIKMMHSLHLLEEIP